MHPPDRHRKPWQDVISELFRFGDSRFPVSRVDSSPIGCPGRAGLRNTVFLCRHQPGKPVHAGSISSWPNTAAGGEYDPVNNHTHRGAAGPRLSLRGQELLISLGPAGSSMIKWRHTLRAAALVDDGSRAGRMANMQHLPPRHGVMGGITSGFIFFSCKNQVPDKNR